MIQRQRDEAPRTGWLPSAGHRCRLPHPRGPERADSERLPAILAQLPAHYCPAQPAFVISANAVTRPPPPTPPVCPAQRETQPLRITQGPRPPTDHRPPAPTPANHRPEGPPRTRVPGLGHLCHLSTDARTQSDRKRPAGLAGPRGGTMVRSASLQAGSRALLTVHLRGASRAPPGRPRRRVACSQPRRLSPFIHSPGSGWRLPAEAGAGRGASGREGRGREPGAGAGSREPGAPPAAGAERGGQARSRGRAPPGGEEAMLMRRPASGRGRGPRRPPGSAPGKYPPSPASPRHPPEKPKILDAPFPSLSPKVLGGAFFSCTVRSLGELPTRTSCSCRTALTSS